MFYALEYHRCEPGPTAQGSDKHENSASTVLCCPMTDLQRKLLCCNYLGGFGPPSSGPLTRAVAARLPKQTGLPVDRLLQ